MKLFKRDFVLGSSFCSRARSRFDLVTFAFAGLAPIVIGIPVLMLSGNAREFVNPMSLLWNLVIFSFVLCSVFSLIIITLPRSIGMALSYLVGSYGLSVVVFDAVVPLTIGPIVKGNEAHEALASAYAPGMIQVATIVLIWLVCSRLSVKLRRNFGLLFATISVLGSAPAFFGIVGERHHGVSTQETTHNVTGAPDFNVYHIVFDSYIGPWFDWTAEELKIDRSSFSDFVRYPNAKSNNPATIPSFSSFMTGTVYSSDQSIRDWYARANDDSIVDDMHKLGFKSTLYTIFSLPGLKKVQTKIFESQLTLALMCDYWLLRIVPVGVRHLVFDKAGGGPLSSMRALRLRELAPKGDVRNINSYLVFQRFLAEEQNRPATGQYVFIYLFFPHDPHQLDRSGKFSLSSSEAEQHLLATNTMVKIIDELKRLERFDRSLIIVQSDHGEGSGAATLYPGRKDAKRITVDPILSEAIGKTDVTHSSGSKIMSLFSPLLMVKPCLGIRRNMPLKDNSSYVQLLDLRLFFRKAVGEKLCDFEMPVPDRIHLYTGLASQIDANGRSVNVGETLPRGNVSRYAVSQKGELSIESPIKFHY